MAENEVKPSTPPPARYRVTFEVTAEVPPVSLAQLQADVKDALGGGGINVRNVVAYKID